MVKIPSVMKRILIAILIFPSIAFSQEVLTKEIASSKTVIDFQSTKGFTMDSGKFTCKIMPVKSNKVLEINSSARGGYPSVALKPSSGRWDLGKYDAVLMDIHNLDDTPARVLLSLNNPGADGRKKCNTESVTVPAKGRGVLKVPHGMWHGYSGNNIDRSNIISIAILLDQPKRDHHFTVDNIRPVTYKRVNTKDLYNSSFYKGLKPFFGRGINLGNALEAPKEGVWSVTLKKEYFSIIKKAGFDNIRVPVRWNAHADEKPPYTINDTFFKRVDWVLESAFEQDLKVVLNMHHYNEYFENVKKHDARFLALWRQIAKRYRKYPDTLCFELLNEPHGQMSSIEWNRISANTIREIRKTNPNRWIMVGPTHFNNIGKLDELKLSAKDRRIVVTVHYYSPFEFTHQGASWTSSSVKNLKNIRWQGTKKERDAVRKDLDKAITWAIQHKRPIYLGEFGAYSPGAMADRALWTKCISEEAAKRKMGSAYWEFCAGFGAYDRERKDWNKPLLNALIW